MGKGDKRTKKGKRIMGTYGNSRKRKVSSPVIITKGSKSASTEQGTKDKVKEVKNEKIKNAVSK